MSITLCVQTDATFTQAVEVEVLNIPHLPDKGTHKVFFDPSNLYIDASDFKEVQNI